MENKNLICGLLAQAIVATRAGRDIQSLTYDRERELVYVYSLDSTDPIRIINVACDSGIAMIRDIMNNINL